MDADTPRPGLPPERATSEGPPRKVAGARRSSRSRLRVGPVAALAVVVAGAAAAAALETETVSSFWRGLWWSVSLLTTVGFLGETPRTTAGAVLSVVLMLGGFVLLAFLSAALASLFVQEDEEPAELTSAAVDREVLATLAEIRARLADIERRLDGDGPPAPGHRVGDR